MAMSGRSFGWRFSPILSTSASAPAPISTLPSDIPQLITGRRSHDVRQERSHTGAQCRRCGQEASF